MEHSSDHVLIDKSRAGDMTAFRMLVLRHERRVAGVVRTMMGATAEAEDVGQEVFIRFYDSLNKFRDDTNVRPYLLRLSITLSLNEIKRNKRTTYGFTRVEADAEKKGTGTTDLKELLYGAFSLLDPELQAVVALRLIEGYSTEETAGILEIPVGTVLLRLSRAQQKLRLLLSDKLKS